MRKEIEITVKDRDKDLTFKIQEMPATKQEKWLTKAMLLLSGNKDESGLNTLLKTNSPLAFLTLLGDADETKVFELFDELLRCCSFVSNGVITQLSPDTADGIISDFQTLFKLRLEAFKLNFGFFIQGNQ